MKIKQLFHFVLACGLMLSTASCTDEVVTNNGDGTDSAEVPEGMQALTLKVGGISGGNVTKAGGIAKPEEIEVNDMTIYIFKYDPAKGADDTDNANYTLYDYWTYMKTAITGYTANDRDLHTFNLGGSGQFRTATVYVPKDAGKVKCLVTTGIGVPITPDGKGAYVANTQADYMTLLSGHVVNARNTTAPSITGYKYEPYSATVKAWTLEELKKATWREPKLLDMPSTRGNSTPSSISDDYWQTPLSMTGISAMMDLGIQTGNSSQVEATLKRHVSRLDIINGNSLDIRKIELINLPFSTNFTPAVDGIEASTQINLGTSKSTASGDEPVDSYTLLKIYDEGTAMTNAITAYVYPNLPYNTSETAKNTPFIRVSIGDTPDIYILPLRTKNEDGNHTPVNLKSNHRYTLVFNRLGDNFLDYNIVIEDWQAGADFNVNLGQDVTEKQFNYQPAFLSYTENPGWNQTIMEGEKAYCYLTGNSTITGIWRFRTAPTLYIASDGSYDDARFNILKSSSQGGIGTPVKADDYTLDEIGLGSDPSYFIHNVSFSSPLSSTPQYSTYWYTVRNPFNPGKSTRAKVEYVLHPTSEQDKWAFEEALFAMAETNALMDYNDDQTIADFQADFYYTKWPEKGVPFVSNKVQENATANPEPLLPPFDVTGTALDNSTGIDLAAGGFKKFTDNGIDYTIASNGNAKTPCLILQTDVGMRMWERIKGDDGINYIRILSVPSLHDTFSSFEAMRSAIRNIENGHDSTYGYIVRYFPEENYWQYNAVGNKRFSFASGTFGKLITEGSVGYIRSSHAISNLKRSGIIY